MQLSSVTNTDFTVVGTEHRAVSRISPLEREASPILDLGRLELIVDTLKSVPDLRPEAMARVRELYQDVPYPPNEIINGISHLIAKHLEES